MARFNFTGVIGINSLDSKMPYMTKNKDDAKFEWKKFSCSIAASKSNRAFLEIFGGKSDTIKTKDQDNNDIEIDLDDRFDEDIIKSVANYRKHIFEFVQKEDDTYERKEFIYDYDAVEYLIKNVKKLEGKKVCITGNTKKNIYGGKASDVFQIQNIYVVDDDVDNSFRVTDVFYWNKNSEIDTDNFDEDKKIYLSGYTSDFIDKKTLGEEKGANKYVPRTITLDCSKLDFENEKHMDFLNFYLSSIGLKRGDKNKISSALKGKNYYKQQIEFEYYNGAEEVEWTEDMLTDYQKKQCKFFGKKPEDFKPAGNAYGDRVTLYKIKNFPARSGTDYEDGYVDTELTPDEFEDDILVIPEVEDKTIEEAIEESITKKQAKKKVVEDEDDDEDMESLF